MSKFNYDRVLEATQTEIEHSGMAPVVARALDKVLKLSHPEREQAFLNWALSSNLCDEAKVGEYKKKFLDEMSV